ncbi:conserved hypothetical protein [Rippkaea orientalis PCC 8801]|uniref:DUF2079 domain-containing protein n=1 Tax=Rippkaea orientalis (strain PCC 8801 / RF-1) TaxID=41431 RepID=B7K014_RIPO1|nr:DUF2079 domain-containing protein [Rippkaea orientalis]ACK66161.1 conserved hypothetical protein [Rippkaea orientalis PCC 8801]
MQRINFKFHPVGIMIAVSTVILLICSSLRHILFQSTAYDLTIFDNGIYLISQGETPFVSLRGIHILGDHAAFILYLVAVFYKIYPTVYWLFFLQAFSLSLGALPVWQLAKQANLSPQLSTAIAASYLLYPLIFNVNLFDFHPEVMAIPAFFWAVLAVRNNVFFSFILAILIILSCRDALSISVAAMGIWLIIGEKKVKFGLIALGIGIFWFILATKVIVPQFSGEQVAAVARYGFLGGSLSEIILNLFLKPGLVLSHLFTADNLEYLVLLLSPLLWGLLPQYFAPLISAFPILFLNLLTQNQEQKDLLHQYSLPILPFLILVVIATLAAGKGWLKRPKSIILWSLVAFFALAKPGYFTSRYLEAKDTWQATTEALTQVSDQGNVLTSANIAPHLSHRSVVELAIDGSDITNLQQFDDIVLNKRHPGWNSSPQLVETLINRIEQIPEFKLTYQKDDVYLFQKQP